MQTSSFIYLLAGAHGILFSAALILSGIRKKGSRLFLGIILFVCSIELINVGVMPTGYHHQPTVFPFWLLGSYLLLPPALNIFLASNTIPGYSISRRQWWLFVPAIVEVFTETVAFYINRFTGAEVSMAQSVIWAIFTEILPIGWTIAVLIRYWARLGRLQKERTSFRHPYLLKQCAFLLFFTLLTGLWAADSILYFRVYPITQALLCTALFILGYIVYFIPAFFETPAVTAVNKTVQPAFPQYKDPEEWERLRQLFETHKRHLQPRLTLEEVATGLNLPARYVSALISQQAQTNFTTFVNTYRVNEVLSRIKDPRESHKTLLGIALDSGFNSKSSFNQLFKTITGLTPSAYLAKHKTGVQEHDSGRPVN